VVDSIAPHQNASNMGSTARLYGSITLGLALLGCAIVLYCEEAHLSVTVRLTSGFSSPPADRYLAQFQSARLCKRFSLPSEYFNDTSGPYNPAAARNPKTGEWLLLFTYDEASSIIASVACTMLIHIWLVFLAKQQRLQEMQAMRWSQVQTPRGGLVLSRLQRN